MSNVIDWYAGMTNLAMKNCYVRVDYEGNMIFNQPCSREDLYEATLVILRRGDGKFVVYKDRYGEHGVVVTESKARSLAKARSDSRKRFVQP